MEAKYDEIFFPNLVFDDEKTFFSKDIQTLN